jgi:hypothetical protein
MTLRNGEFAHLSIEAIGHLNGELKVGEVVTVVF